MESSKTPTWDVIVVGVGTVGSMALRHLARSGSKVLGIEQYGVAHDRGGAGGESRLLRVNDLRPEEVGLARRSRVLLESLGAETGQKLFGSTGVLHIVPEGDPAIERILSCANASGEHATAFSSEELRERYPRHRVNDQESAVLDHAAGYIRPEASVMAACLDATANGAELWASTTVQSITPANDGYLVQTSRGLLQTRKILITAGAWSRRLLPAQTSRAHVRRIVMSWFGTKDPELFHESVFPAWSRTLADGTHFFGAPSLDGASVKVALIESYGDMNDPAEASLEVSEEELASVVAVATAHIDGVIPAVIRRGVYFDLFSNDDEFIIRPLDGSTNGIVATGLSGRGFKLAPALGEDLAALLLSGGVPAGLRHWL